MKILHVASEYPPAKIYGLGRFVHGLARAQAELGHDVHVLTNSSGGAGDDVVLDGVRVHRIAFPNPPRPPDGHGEVLQFNHGALARLLDRRERFADADVVASHDWLTAFAAREAARLLGAPLVVTFHDEVVGKHFGLLDARGRYVRDVEALTAHDASVVVANSAYIARQVERHYGADPERVVPIPGGIDPAVFDVSAPHLACDFRAALAEPGETLVAYVGRLDPEKGLETLAEAVERVTEEAAEIRFVLAGSGGRAEALEARLGERARLLGYVGGEALAYLYRAADVVVVPSVYEPFGLVALEALLGRAAVVVAASGGLAEIVRDGEDGLQVPPGDAQALADAVLDLARDPGRRERLAAAGERRAREDFAWSTIAARTVEAYAKARADPRPVRAEPPAPPADPPVSVVLRAGEDPARAETALRSLLARTDSGDLEVLVAAEARDGALGERTSDGPADRLAPVVEELGRAGHRVALVRSREEALGRAQGDYVCLLSDAVELPAGAEGWLRALLWLLEDKAAATASPVTLQPDGTIACAGGSAEGPRLRGEPDRPGLAGEPRPVAWNRTECLLTRRATLEEAGLPGDDERPWGEALAERTGRRHWVHPARVVRRAPEPPSPGPELARTLEGGSPAGELPASVVVVAYGQLDHTRRAVEAVLRHTEPSFELVLVDNGSPDATRAYFRGLRSERGETVRVLENVENLGYPTAANQGARAARGRHVVLLNNDTEVRPGWLTALLDAAAEEDVGVVAPKVLNPDGTVQNAGGILHTPDGDHAIPHAGEDRLAPPVTAPRDLENAGGPCMLLTPRLLDQVGLFDEGFSPGYFEDSDLCLRARQAGLRLRYAPGAEVVHEAKVTSSAVAREGKLDVWGRFEENRRRFLTRWRSRLEEDQRARERATGDPPRRRVLLCYHRSATTTAAYCEAALRLDHEVVTAGRGQDLDLGPDAPAAELVAAAGGVDLLLAVEGESYVPPGLDAVSCPTAWWAIDNHCHAATPDGWHFEQARAFDHVLVAQRDYVPAFRARGLSASWLPLACDPDVHRPEPVEADLDVVFVGHVRPFHRRRRRLLDRLARRFRVEEVQGVYREDMARLLARAKVVFNCSLAGDLNMRVFEALAAGGLLVTDRIGNGLEDLFAPGEHLALYDEDDLEAVVGHALRDAEARARIAARGQRLVLRHHTYRHRMQHVLAHAATPELERTP